MVRSIFTYNLRTERRCCEQSVLKFNSLLSISSRKGDKKQENFDHRKKLGTVVDYDCASKHVHISVFHNTLQLSPKNNYQLGEVAGLRNAK